MMALQKHLLNDPESLVIDSLAGLCAVNNQLVLDPPSKGERSDPRFEVARSLTRDGGSRLQLPPVTAPKSRSSAAAAPAMSLRMLDSSVRDTLETLSRRSSSRCGPGEGCSAPRSAATCSLPPSNAAQVRRGMDLVENDAGTLILVKNYTGDVLNFGLAAEQYAAEHADKSDRVKFIVVGDDVALGPGGGGRDARRGAAVAQWVSGRRNDRGRAGTLPCIATLLLPLILLCPNKLQQVPGTASPSHSLGTSEIEIGLGIHNEPGNQRLSCIPPLSELMVTLLDLITLTTDPERAYLPFQNDGKDEVVLLVNNLGGMSELELGGVVRALLTRSCRRGRSSSAESSPALSCLNMPGFFISLVLLPRADESDAPKVDKLLMLLDAPAKTPGWKWSSGTAPITPTPLAPSAVSAVNKASSANPAVLREIEAGNIAGSDLVSDVVAISKVAETRMGGTSGAIYSIYLSALAQGIQTHAQNSAPEMWERALASALAKLYTYTRARPPSRTLVDPLAAFVNAFPDGFFRRSEGGCGSRRAHEGRRGEGWAQRVCRCRDAQPGAGG
ncbi:unnamed protein product [Mycena citricolor]|uniref:DhaK domain-containing protein n=1 Tax=Mycena citricolor TaxID=2018698 RepID=A0AAD2GY20_9AGAR|nr:unnamed protein product [Mycena citricolor]